jgi:hypothetical protein
VLIGKRSQANIILIAVDSSPVSFYLSFFDNLLINCILNPYKKKSGIFPDFIR